MPRGPNVAALITALKVSFHNRFWEYERSLGYGSYGFTVLLSLREEFQSAHRRVAFKFGLRKGQQALRDEAAMLARLNGAKHIVSIIGFCDDVDQVVRAEDTGDCVISLTNVPPSAAYESFVTINGPALALEFLELGSINDLVDRMWADDRKIIPNRVLWSIFLCMIRATIGMAYPVGADIGTPPIVEEIGPGDPALIVHRDIHDGNAMFTTDENDAEHNPVPMLKLIDFGLARDLADGNNPATWHSDLGWELNLQDVVKRIMALITGGGGWDPNVNLANHNGFPSRAEGILGQDGDARPPYPRLCPDLRDLLARCMYEDPTMQPSLLEVLETARSAVLTKTAASFPDPASETDDALRSFVQDMFYDADEDED